MLVSLTLNFLHQVRIEVATDGERKESFAVLKLQKLGQFRIWDNESLVDWIHQITLTEILPDSRREFLAVYRLRAAEKRCELGRTVVHDLETPRGLSPALLFSQFLHLFITQGNVRQHLPRVSIFIQLCHLFVPMATRLRHRLPLHTELASDIWERHIGVCILNL